MRIAARWFQNSQTSAADDLLKWALRGENRAVKDAVSQVMELNMIWSDVQRDFSGKPDVKHSHLFVGLTLSFISRPIEGLSATI